MVRERTRISFLVSVPVLSVSKTSTCPRPSEMAVLSAVAGVCVYWKVSIVTRIVIYAVLHPQIVHGPNQ